MRRFVGGVALRPITNELLCRLRSPNFAKSLSITTSSGNPTDKNQNNGSFESADDFERRIFSHTIGSNSSSDAFYGKLDRLEKIRSRHYGGDSAHSLDGLDESSSSLHDGLGDKLGRAGMNFEFDSDTDDEDDSEDEFRPDVNFEGPTYDIKDLDLSKPGVNKPKPQEEFVVTTEEVLERADFRNVRFLANFITDAGIIIKRSQTGISAKAQRKIAREIKTARAFGLMPFTTMGTKSFVYGRSMEDRDEAYEYETFNGRLVVDDNENNPLES